MTAQALRDRLRSHLPPSDETGRLVDLAVHRLPPTVAAAAEEPALSRIADTLGEYLGALWYDSLPEIAREVAVRLAPLTPLLTPNPAPSELADALERAEEIVRSLHPSIAREGCARDIERLRKEWEPIRGDAVASRLTALLGPRMQRDAREEALQRCVHRMSLPLKMLSQELPAYLRFMAHSGMNWPASSFGWRSSEGRWEPPEWAHLEELNDRLSREPTVERLARTVAVAPTGKSETTAPRSESAGSGVPGQSERGNSSENLSGTRPRAVATAELPLGGVLDAEELFLLRRRERAWRIAMEEETPEPWEAEPTDREKRHTIEETTPLDSPPPVALVLDTTGSMRGEAEGIARALTFGLLKHAVSRGRRLILLIFSTTVHRLELSPDSPAIGALPRFLDDAFGSGAAAVPALRDVLRQAQRESWSEADILFVTDSREARLSPTTEEQLAELRRRSSLRLHGLTINDFPMTNPGNLFDYTWHYASSRTLRPGISSEQFGQT